jgi:hypothetical protein
MSLDMWPSLTSRLLGEEYAEGVYYRQGEETTKITCKVGALNLELAGRL